MADTETAPKAEKTEKKSEETPKSTSSKSIEIKDLLDAGLHFGHQTKRWNPKMKRYIFDKRNGIHIIDLTKSLDMLNEALDCISKTVEKGKKVLFVGTKKQAQVVTKEVAVECEQYYVTSRWLGGTLTNSPTIRRSIKRMRELEAMQAGDGFSTHKKEASKLRREYEKLAKNLSGIADMHEYPGVMFVIDINKEAIAINEANKLGIPVVAIVDTCCDPDSIDYIIPGNDDSIRSIKLVLNAAADVIKDANAKYRKKEAEIAKKQAEAKAAAEKKAKAKAEAEAKAKKEAAAEQKKAAKAKEEKKPAKPKAEAKKTDDKEAAKETKEKSSKPAAKAKKPASKEKEDKPKAKKTASKEKEDKPSKSKAAAKKADDKEAKEEK